MLNQTEIQKQVYLGAQTGAFVITTAIIAAKFVPLDQYPFLNRLFEVGVCNVYINDFLNPITLSNNEGYTNNFLYRGAGVQAIKWFPNLWVQNYCKEILPAHPIKPGICQLAGMVPFFTMGSIEAKLDDQYKMIFTMTSLATFLAIPYIYDSRSHKTINNAVIFSFQDALKAEAGMTAGFILMDYVHLLEIPTIKEYAGLFTLTATILIANEGYNIINNGHFGLNNLAELARVAAFPIAKVAAVSLVEIAFSTPVLLGAISTAIVYEGYKFHHDIQIGIPYQQALWNAINDAADLSFAPLMAIAADTLWH